MIMFERKNNAFEELGFMVDCSRGAVPRIETLKKTADLLAGFGYTYLSLYLEDLYEIEGEPYFGYKRGRYSREEIRELDRYCRKIHLELRPCIQTLAHLGRLKPHRDYAGLFDIDDILNIDCPETYALIEKMFSTLRSCFTSSCVHIGMDEAMNLGRGKFLDRNGKTPRSEMMERHLKRVSAIAEKYAFRCEIWADMCALAYREAENPDQFVLSIPENIVPVVWRYEKIGRADTRKELEMYRKICPGRLHYAGGAWKWIGLVPANRYSFEVIREQIEELKIQKVPSYLLTAWADSGSAASLFSVLPSVFYASLLAHGHALDREAKAYFRMMTSVDFDEFLKIDDLNRFSEKEEGYRGNGSFLCLYNDLFLGIFDEAVPDAIGNWSKKCVRRLSRLIKNEAFGYLFASIRDLASINQDKATLSKEIYANYRSGNKENLRENVGRIDKILPKIDQLIADFKKQWLKENKAYGLEKHLIRLGGLKERLIFCREQIVAWIEKKIDRIDELEEERRDISYPYWNHEEPENNYYNEYAGVVSGNHLSEI